ncbi:MAG: hypothetical protein AAB834_03275 [Patescibacteria group bacterium]
MPPTVTDTLKKINKEILNPIIALLFAVALVVFLWGLVEFVASAEGDQGRLRGKQHMLWGVVGMTIMVGARAIILIVTNTFGLPPPDLGL